MGVGAASFISGVRRTALLNEATKLRTTQGCEAEPRGQVINSGAACLENVSGLRSDHYFTLLSPCLQEA